ncbi:MAG: exodeoxyribonuclease VII small subunit [Ruminococcus sp.]|nr:exodeoxyribonuclease VII small subunit [Ruminococcus sp.]
MEKYTIDSAMLRLKEITEELESGECDLEASMKIYEEGVRLVAFCNKSLSAAKQRIVELSELDMNGDEVDE